MSEPTQCDQILSFLKTGVSLTPLEALSMFGTMRLGARIYELREAGHKIHATMVQTPSGKWVASYRMDPERQAEPA